MVREWVWLAMALGVAPGWLGPDRENPPGATTGLATRHTVREHAQGVTGGAEAAVFDGARRSVFVVETEAGFGSGFLVHPDGLVLTNDHVLGDTRYVAVGVDPGRKHPAVAVARDTLHDLAVLRVHPRAVAGLPALSLADQATDPRLGDRVLAVTGVLTQVGAVLTTGVVSRLTADLIIADLTVNAGSSGGPLLDMEGEVLGVNTFWVKTPAGPGLAGIVRAHVAAAVLDRARESLDSPPPPCDRLPVASPTPYPAAALLELAQSIRDPSVYRATTRGVQIDVVTPPSAFRHAYAAELRSSTARGRPFATTALYDWRSTTGEMEAIVGIRVMEGSDRRPGESGWRASTTSGKPAGVARMRLLRCGTEVTPIVPGRVCTSASGDGVPASPGRCAASYQYRPGAFAPGGRLELHVEGDAVGKKPLVWKLPTALVERVWADFTPHFALEAGARELEVELQALPMCP